MAAIALDQKQVPQEFFVDLSQLGSGIQITPDQTPGTEKPDNKKEKQKLYILAALAALIIIVLILPKK